MMLCAIFALLQFAAAKSEERYLDNVYCGVPRPTVVAVDPKTHNYFPYYVTLHRCQGSWQYWRPSVKKCVGTTYTEVKTNVYSPFTGLTSTITLQNHTECGSKCVKESTECDFSVQFWEPKMCRCGCKYPEGPPTPCNEGFRWSSVYCKCQCNKPPRVCPIRQEWSPELCDCTCDERVVKRCARKKKMVDHETCTCVDAQALMNNYEGAVNSRMYITLLVLQSCVIVILISLLVHWIRKKHCPQGHSTSKYNKAQMRDSMDTLNSDSTDKKQDSDAGSVAIEMPGVERQVSTDSEGQNSLDRETDL